MQHTLRHSLQGGQDSTEEEIKWQNKEDTGEDSLISLQGQDREGEVKVELDVNREPGLVFDRRRSFINLQQHLAMNLSRSSVMAKTCSLFTANACIKRPVN